MIVIVQSCNYGLKQCCPFDYNVRFDTIIIMYYGMGHIWSQYQYLIPKNLKVKNYIENVVLILIDQYMKSTCTSQSLVGL
jgi:hypothetical protein